MRISYNHTHTHTLLFSTFKMDLRVGDETAGVLDYSEIPINRSQCIGKWYNMESETVGLIVGIYL